jgi:hypothetical protein
MLAQSLCHLMDCWKRAGQTPARNSFGARASESDARAPFLIVRNREPYKGGALSCPVHVTTKPTLVQVAVLPLLPAVHVKLPSALVVHPAAAALAATAETESNATIINNLLTFFLLLLVVVGE